MTLFKTQTHLEVWQMRWCHTCFQPDEAQRRLQGKDTVCPIWEKAIRTGRKPVQWDRVKTDLMEHTIRCNAYEQRPALTRQTGKNTAAENLAMFDVQPVCDVGDHA
jgi:hypothetical protein